MNSVYFIVQKRQWSPIDEYAHMDYIIKLSTGHIPKISDPISDEIILDIQQHPNRSVAKKIQSRNELGLANYSYQAKHPPVYYTALIIPNQLMTYCDVPIYHRLRITRLISYGLYVLGVVLLVFVFRELKKIFRHIPSYFPWLVILFSLLIFPHERYGLGNNALSPMMIHASFYFLIRYIISNRLKDLCMVILFTSLSVCVALTNIFLIPFILLIACLYLFKNFSRKYALYAMLAGVPASVIFACWKYYSYTNSEIGLFIEQTLQKYIPASMVDYPIFLKIFWSDLFTIHILQNTLDLGILMTWILILNLSWVAFKFRTIVKSHQWLMITLIIIAFLFIEMYFLNRFIDSVTWVAYRHYLGFTGLLFTAFFAGLCCIGNAKEPSEINSNKSYLQACKEQLIEIFTSNPLSKNTTR